jgi:hypothetical protein
MKKFTYLSFIGAATVALIITAFITTGKDNIPVNLTPAAGEITLTPSEPSTEFPDAAITKFKLQNDSDSTRYSFEMKNYVLGNQTADASAKLCANSAKGQHIHLILNNGPYEAWYTPSFSKKLAEGHYVSMTFLSRSYHESIKSSKTYELKQYNVGKDAGTKNNDIDLKAPMLFYSRPKGEYTGKDTRKVLLDFFLVNTSLKANGNRVRATINGKEFMITDWKPYYIEGLPMGESTVKLELLDKDNKPVTCDKMFQTVERKITLKD